VPLCVSSLALCDDNACNGSCDDQQRTLLHILSTGLLLFLACNVLGIYCNFLGLALDLEDYHPSVLLHSWLGHLTCKIVSEMTYNVSSGTLNPTIPYHTIRWPIQLGVDDASLLLGEETDGK